VRIYRKRGRRDRLVQLPRSLCVLISFPFRGGLESKHQVWIRPHLLHLHPFPLFIGNLTMTPKSLFCCFLFPFSHQRLKNNIPRREPFTTSLWLTQKFTPVMKSRGLHISLLQQAQEFRGGSKLSYFYVGNYWRKERTENT